MELQHIELSKLTVSKANARRHGGKDVDDLIASIRSLGVIQPLLVRPDGEGFEVIAGQRRLRAIQALEAETGESGPVPCAILDSGDDAGAVEASLAENIARLPMDEIDQYKAFAALKKDGLTVADIAARFGITELLVKKRLAIAALFPVDRYDGSIVSDLFGEQRYFDDAEKFWKLQMQAVIERQAAYLDAGWSDVVIMDIGRHWTAYDKVQCGKKDGGKVYISCAANGEIGFHEGWLDEKEAGRLDRARAKAQAKAEGKDDAPARPELTKAAIRYMELHRHNAARVELLKQPQIALRLIAASIIGKAGLWDVSPESQSANGNKEVAASTEQCRAQKAFAKERRAVREILGLEDKPALRFLIGPRWDMPEPTALFARLLTLSDEQVLRVLTFVMAECLEAGSAEVEALGQMLHVDMAGWWQPDETFFDLLRDKPAINAMVAEVAGKNTAAEFLTATAKAQKSVIRACLEGTNGRRKVEGWLPRYMRFPMRPYTKRGGLPAVEQGAAIKKLFAKTP